VAWYFVKHMTRPYLPRLDRLLGPPTLLSEGYEGLCPGVKRQGREADHSPPFSAEVKNARSYTSAPNTSSWRDA